MQKKTLQKSGPIIWVNTAYFNMKEVKAINTRFISLMNVGKCNSTKMYQNLNYKINVSFLTIISAVFRCDFHYMKIIYNV